MAHVQMAFSGRQLYRGAREARQARRDTTAEWLGCSSGICTDGGKELARDSQAKKNCLWLKNELQNAGEGEQTGLISFALNKVRLAELERPHWANRSENMAACQCRG